MVMNTIPVALICDDNFVMPTCVAVTSLVENANETTIYDIYIIMAECSKLSETKILELENNHCKISIIRKSLEQYSDIKQLAHISKACLIKFEVSNIVDKYDKVIYLDGDVIVRGDLSDLYNISFEDEYAAGVKDLDGIYEDKGNINAGIMVFNAKKIRDENILPLLVKTRKELGDRGSMDQQTYNIVFHNKYIYLPIRYNCVAAKLVGSEHRRKYKYLSIDKLNRLYGTSYRSNKQLVEDALIIHYATSFKPWVYTFASGSKEWYYYYLRSPYRNEQFKLQGRWLYRINKIVQNVKNNGLKGLIIILRTKFKDRTNGEKIKWE